MAKNLNEYLFETSPKNICNPEIVLNRSVNGLLDLFLENINYCISEGYPSTADLKSYAGVYLNKKHIYIDSQVQESDPEKLVLLGKSNAQIDVSGFIISQIYAKDQSKLTLHAGQNAFIIIDALDNAHVDASAVHESKVIINLYGNATATCEGNVTIINKNKLTY